MHADSSLHAPIAEQPPVSENPIDREALRRYIELLGNPYAKSQLIGGEELDLVARPTEGDLREPTPEEREYARRQGNQYTLLSVSIVESQNPPARRRSQASTPRERSAPAMGMSKKDFGEGCRRIFRHYIPAAEKGRLRRHHTDFITRNQNRLPVERHLLLQELAKYDLSKISGVQAHFNRERIDMTELKLKQIEESVLGKTK
jgi:hypothetical protein